MKRKVVLYLTLDEYGFEYDLWDHCPVVRAGVFWSRDGRRSVCSDICAGTVKQVLGITLKLGQCKPLEIRPLPLVKAKDLKQ